MKSRIITISREFGSGGRTIGKKAAEQLGIPCYDAELIQKLAEESGFSEGYVKEAGEWFLRVYIDKEGGITVNDCEAVAREMNEILDREDFVEDSYVFEVSSPGLGRPLKKEKDYVRNMGKEIEIRTYRAIDRCKEFTGILKAYDDTSVTIADENDKETTFLKTDIALIRQAIDF